MLFVFLYWRQTVFCFRFAHSFTSGSGVGRLASVTIVPAHHQESFTRLVTSAEARARLGATLCLCWQTVKLIQLATISKKRVAKTVVHAYTDASLGNVHEGGTVYPMVGGIIFAGSVPQAFSIEVTNTPRSVKPHIGIYEAIAVDVARRLFAEVVRKSWVVWHIDNQADCYSFTSGTTHCHIASAVVNNFLAAARRDDLAGYFAWIRTKRNISDCLTRMDRLHILRDNFPHAMIETTDVVVDWDSILATAGRITGCPAGNLAAWGFPGEEVDALIREAEAVARVDVDTFGWDVSVFSILDSGCAKRPRLADESGASASEA